MKGISIVAAGDAPRVAGHPVAGHRAGGSAVRALGPPGFSLWMVELEMLAGERVELPDEHGDEVLYVCSGELRIGDAASRAVCPPGGAVIVESKAHPPIEAVGPTRVLHMGPTVPERRDDGVNGPIARVPDVVHVVGPAGRFALSGPSRAAKYFADSTCAGCRATLLYNSRQGSYAGEPHSHSQDELIYVLSGEIRFGAHRVRPGDTVAIVARQRYSFRSDDGFAFLNYRCGGSMHISVDGRSRPEGALVNGMHAVPNASQDWRPIV